MEETTSEQIAAWIDTLRSNLARVTAERDAALAALQALNGILNFAEEVMPYETWGVDDPTKQNEVWTQACKVLGIERVTR